MLTNQYAGNTNGGDGSVELRYTLPPDTDVTISSGNAVPEPAGGSSSPVTFTVTLPAVQSVDTIVHYKTIDGTATAAANEYTPVSDGAVTIAAGQTTAQVQIQADPGSGVATVENLGFQVQLTSISGGDGSLTLSQPGDSAFGSITAPGIGGSVTGPGGAAAGGVTVMLTGMAGTGQSVKQTTTTDASGVYQFYVDPGTYTVTPAPPPAGTGNPEYVPVNCPGKAESGACAQFALGSGANLTVPFKEVSLVVNSTSTATDNAEAQEGICDADPQAPQTVCTLAQAILVATDGGGAETIGFDIPGKGLPVITAGAGMPQLPASVTIDGTTQPGAGRVQLSGSGAGGTVGLWAPAGATTIRGMVISGYSVDLELGSFTDAGSPIGNPQGGTVDAISGPDPAGGDTVQDDILGAGPTGSAVSASPIDFTEGGAIAPTRQTVAAGLLVLPGGGGEIGGTVSGQGNTIRGGGPNNSFDYAGSLVVHYAADDVIEGNTIDGLTLSQGDAGSSASTASNTVGGAAAGAGNTIFGRTTIADEAGDVVQGDELGQLLVDGDRNTIGGATDTPGQPPGNILAPDPRTQPSDPAMTISGAGNVVQGNEESGFASGIAVGGPGGDTIGGDDPALGNELTGTGVVHHEPGIELGAGSPASSTNTIAGNRITDFGYAVDLEAAGSSAGDPVADTIVENRMPNVGLPIAFGDVFLSNALGRRSGPNHGQAYPDLFTARAGRSVHVTGALDFLAGVDARKRYRIDIYADGSCSRDSIAVGGADLWLGSTTATTGLLGTAMFSLDVVTPPPGERAITATATGPDGSTSEVSTCLTIGHTAASFTKSGVTTPGGITTGGGPASARDAAAAAAAAAAARPMTATLHLFCPPITTGSCTGTVTVASTGRSGRRIVRRSFALAPDELAGIPFRLPAAISTHLRHHQRPEVSVSITAHDAAHHTRRTAKLLTLRGP
jgi:hypothetical protein